MNNNNRLKIFFAVASLSMVTACASQSGPDTSEVVDGTPSEIKDRSTLGEEINQYNAQSKTSPPALATDRRRPTDDLAEDPAAGDLASDINAYNSNSQPDDSSAAIDGRQPSTIDRPRSPEERRATRQLSQDVRNYNRSGGSSDRVRDDGGE